MALELEEFGYGPRWHALLSASIASGLLPGRVVRGDRGSALVVTATGIVRAQPSTRLLRSIAGPTNLPTVGDWVALIAPKDLDVPQIDVVAERASAIARGDSGKSGDVQVLAANVDVVFVAHPIAEAPNLRRIERELALAWSSGATPVVVLTKADLSAEPEAARAAVEAIAPGADVQVTSAVAGAGVEPLREYVRGQRTAVLIGPSGAGKSTLINALLGESRQATREVRVGDGRGRHVTVARELIPLPGGGVLIDTPGLRALVLTGSEDGIASAFPDIDGLASSCRFRDCTHRQEPGCAVQAAVAGGTLAADRLASYHKLVREAEVAAAKTDARLRAEEERKWKTIAKAVKEHYSRRPR